MPYSNIVFVKLFLSLFEEDDRFLYQLTESQQLLYIKMLYMAGSTNNQIPINLKFICNKVNYHHEESCFLSDIERIKKLFPRFIEKDGFYYFNNFNELHNFIGNSKGTPKELQRIIPEKSKSKRRVRIREENTSLNTPSTIVDPYKLIFETWNERMPWKINEITVSRRKALAVRLREPAFVANYNTLLTKILESDFLSGRKPTKEHGKWYASFDWIIKNDTNYQKILEGRYDNKEAEG